MLASPEVGGGIEHVADSLAFYVRSKSADRDLLIRYGEQFDQLNALETINFEKEIEPAQPGTLGPY
jgi:hypothetical protein